MPSTVRTTGVTNIDGQISTNTSILNGKIASRLRVLPEDIDLIKDTYNLYIQHTHQMYDLQYAAFANTPPRGSADRTTTSESTEGATALPYTIQLDDDNHTSMADDVFDMVENFNNFAHGHYHEWDDQAF